MTTFVSPKKTRRSSASRAAAVGSSTVRYASGTTAFGTAYLFLSDKGIRALRLMEKGEEATGLAEVRQLLGGAELVHDPKAVAPVLDQLRELLNGERDDMETPLDMRGTPFFRKVWEVMRRVPAGETCSYKDLARRAGRPKAVRAAASACARNPIGILVPCHRIISSDGSLGGYGGGLERKQMLLDWEKSRKA